MQKRASEHTMAKRTNNPNLDLRHVVILQSAEWMIGRSVPLT